MPKKEFLKKHGIICNAIREDVLYFRIPAILVISAGMFVSAREGFNGITSVINFFKYSRSFSELTTAILIGLTLIILGFAILFISLMTVWHNYSSTFLIRVNHKLITHGIYRFVRHPIYWGFLVVAFGIPISVSSLFGLLIMAFLLPIFIIRIRIEEKLLIAEFGDDYLKYKETTSKLIPFLF